MQDDLYLICSVNGKLLSERCVVLIVWSSENKVCNSILDFLHQLNKRIRNAHEEKIAAV